MKTNLPTCRSRAIAGYLIRYNGGTSQFRSGLTNSASLTGTAQTNPGGASISASSGMSLFLAALAFAVWGVMTLGLSLVALAVLGVITASEAAWRMARKAWGQHRVCAWCKESMGGNPFAKATHGICPTCLEIQKSQMANARADSLRPLAIIALLAILHLPSSILAAVPQEQAIRAIVGEAANQGRAGMLAVAGAIRNRGTLKGVYGLKSKVLSQQPEWVWERARLAWAMSATNDISRGATHWENIKAFGEPRWAKSLTVTTNIGSHTFYK